MIYLSIKAQVIFSKSLVWSPDSYDDILLDKLQEKNRWFESSIKLGCCIFFHEKKHDNLRDFFLIIFWRR